MTLVESEVFTSAAAKLGKSPDAIKLAVTELGRDVGKPWSAEEKAAASRRLDYAGRLIAIRLKPD